MGERSEKFLPAFFVPVVKQGEEFAPGELPLHITLFPPLKQQYLEEYSDQLKAAMNPFSAFDVTVEKDDLFGENRDIPVKRIYKSEELERVHGALVYCLGNLSHDSTWRKPYNPHISVETEGQLRDGDTVHVGGFSIVQKASPAGLWKVVDKIGFKGQEGL